MNYSRWATKEEFLEKLTRVSYDTDIKKSGIPMMHDTENLYIKDDEAHTMVIGTTGSGKTQTTVLPPLRLAIKAEESFVLHDVRGEIYELLKDDLTKNNYNIVTINLADPTLGNSFNPLLLPYKLYKEGRKDDAIELLENVGYYFCQTERINPTADPFWVNSACSLFVGLSLYLFENRSEEEITINNIVELSSDFSIIEEYFNTLSKSSIIFTNLVSIVQAPKETKGSILSVFNQNLRLFTTREALSKLLSTTDFDINSIQKEKTALFIITNNKAASTRLTPLIIEEVYQAATLANDKTRRLNILIDEFEYLMPFKNIINMLTLARSQKIRFNIYLNSFLELKNTYGVENTELLKITFGNIIYLLANDFETLEEISKLCGNKKVDDNFEPLITMDELKLLDMFEAIILIPRMNPIRTKLIPDYQIKWEK